MYLVNYIINERVDVLYNKILNNLTKKEFSHIKEFEKMILEEKILEVNLFNESISVNLKGSLSIIEINIKYGRFLLYEDIKERIKLFENQLIKIIKNQNFIYRVDESLVEDYWLSIDDEFWYEKENAFVEFSSWIVKQEELHWSKVIITGCPKSD